MDRRQLFRLIAALGIGTTTSGVASPIGFIESPHCVLTTVSGQDADPLAVSPEIGSRIGVVAVGNAGRVTLSSLSCKLSDLSARVEIDTYEAYSQEPSDFDRSEAILIGTAFGGVHSPAAARDAAIAHVASIEAAVSRFDIVFVLAGMGGATGTGVAPFVAEVARRAGVFTIGVPIIPFDFEGNERRLAALVGVDALQASSDVVFNLSNERFAQSASDSILVESIFQDVNTAFMQLHRCVWRATLCEGHVAVDFEDLRFILAQVGTTSMGIATGSSSNRVDRIAIRAIGHPLMGAEALGKAKGIYVAIRSGTGQVKISEHKRMINTIRTHASPDVCFVYGSTIDPLLGPEIEVCILACGIPNSRHPSTA